MLILFQTYYTTASQYQTHHLFHNSDINNIHTLSENMYELQKQVKKRTFSSFSSRFRSECKLILYLATMYLYCVYPAISKSPKQLPNCLKIAETSVILIVSRASSVTSAYGIYYCFFLSLDITEVPEVVYQVHDTEVYLTPLISTQHHSIAG